MKILFYFLSLVSSLFAESNVEKIQRVVSVKWHQNAHELSVLPVDAGLSNQNYQITIDHNRYFVRCAPAQNALLGTGIEKEWRVASLAAIANLAPKVFFYDPDERIMISEWIDVQNRKVDLRDEDAMKKMCHLLRKLHAMKAPFPNVFSPYDCIRQYAQNAMNAGVILPSVFEDVIFPRVEEIEAAFHGRTKLVPCHLDLYSLNLLDNGERYYLTDWEYAAMGDPLFDLATAPSADLFSDVEMFRLLDVYLERPATQKERRDFYCMRILADARWALWAYLQEKISPIPAPFSEYADHFLEQCLLRISLLEMKKEL